MQILPKLHTRLTQKQVAHIVTRSTEVTPMRAGIEHLTIPLHQLWGVNSSHMRGTPGDGQLVGAMRTTLMVSILVWDILPVFVGTGATLTVNTKDRPILSVILVMKITLIGDTLEEDMGVQVTGTILMAITRARDILSVTLGMGSVVTGITPEKKILPE